MSSRTPALAVALAALALSGCVGGGGPQDAGPVPELDLGPMALETVPLEPFELRGTIQVDWEGGRMGVSTLNEGGMPARAVRDDGVLYTSQTGMGWTRWDLADYVEDSPRGFRYVAWDVPDLLSRAQVVSRSAGQFEATSSYTAAGGTVDVTLDVEHRGTAVQEIRITTPQDPESPFTLRPLGHELAFPVQLPTPVRPADEVARLDATARAGHAKILQWVDQYRSQVGRLPDEPSAESLALQRLNQPWPTSPYDGAAMRNHVASGHFEWLRCSDRDASFHGFGWDGAPLNQDYGTGCSAA